MPPVGFEPAISAVEQPQTYALDRSATGIGKNILSNLKVKETPELIASSAPVLILIHH